MAGDRACCLDSVVHGYHIYWCIWIPVIDEQLDVLYKEDNEYDARAVAVVKGTTVVGH